MNYVQPSISPFGIRIDEPVTVLTDVIVGIVCIYAYYRLKRQSADFSGFNQIRRFFLFIGISTILGGVFGHGFLYYFDQAWQHPAWIESIVSSSSILIPFEPHYIFKLPGWLTGVYAVYLFQQGMVEWFAEKISVKTTTFLQRLNVIEALLATVFILLTFNFLYVVLHILYGLLLIVFTLNLYAYLKFRSRGSLLMVIAVLIMVVSGVVHATKFGLGIWFTHHDVNHTLIAFSIFLFLLGTEALVGERKADLINSSN